MTDNVNHPAHYEAGPFECIELSGRYSFCVGNAIKYIWRHRLKGRPLEDLDKAIWYLERAHAQREPLAPTAPIYPAPVPGVAGLLDQLILVDWAGASGFWTCLRQGRPIPEAVDALRHLRARGEAVA